MILGVAATKDAVVIAEAANDPNQFSIAEFHVLAFEMKSGDDLRFLLQRITDVFSRSAPGAVALLRASSGKFGSALDVIKAEALIELAAAETGLPVVKVAPQVLKKALGCGATEKWRDRATRKFRKPQHENWTKGSAEAAAVAFRVYDRPA